MFLHLYLLGGHIKDNYIGPASKVIPLIQKIIWLLQVFGEFLKRTLFLKRFKIKRKKYTNVLNTTLPPELKKWKYIALKKVNTYIQ